MSKYLDGEGWEDESETDNVKLDDLPPEQKEAWLMLHRRAAKRLELSNKLGELMKISLDRQAPLEQKARVRKELPELRMQIKALNEMPMPGRLNPSSTTSLSDKA